MPNVMQPSVPSGASVGFPAWRTWDTGYKGDAKIDSTNLDAAWDPDVASYREVHPLVFAFPEERWGGGGRGAGNIQP